MAIDWNQYTQQASSPPTQPQGTIDWSKFTSQVPVQNQQQTTEPQDSLATHIAGAVVGGLSSAGGNLLEAGLDAGTWIAEKMGKLHPSLGITSEQAQKAKQQFSDFNKQHFQALNNSGDVFDRSYQRLPWVAAPIQAATEVGGLMKSIPSVGSGLVKTGVQAATGGLTGAGLSGIGARPTEEQDTGAMLGAAIPIGLNTIGAGIKAGANVLASKGNAKVQLQKILEASNKNLAGLEPSEAAGKGVANKWIAIKNIENQAYNTFKEIPGEFSARPVSQAIFKLGQNKGLSDLQKSILTDLYEQATKSKTTGEILKLNQDLSSVYKQFSGSNATPTVFEGFKALQSKGRELMQNIGTKAGVGDAVSKANGIHSTLVKPMQEFGADDIAQAISKNDTVQIAKLTDNLIERGLKSPKKMQALLENMDETGSKIVGYGIVKKVTSDLVANPKTANPAAAVKQINTYISKFKNIKGLEDTVKTLQGVSNVLEKLPKAKIGMSSVIASSAAASAGGAAVGSIFGPGGAAVGAVSGPIVGPAVMKSLQEVASSQAGLKVLNSIGKSPKAAVINDFIKALLTREWTKSEQE